MKTQEFVRQWKEAIDRQIKMHRYLVWTNDLRGKGRSVMVSNDRCEILKDAHNHKRRLQHQIMVFVDQKTHEKFIIKNN